VKACGAPRLWLLDKTHALPVCCKPGGGVAAKCCSRGVRDRTRLNQSNRIPDCGSALNFSIAFGVLGFLKPVLCSLAPVAPRTSGIGFRARVY
jgi:hypothetical protein